VLDPSVKSEEAAAVAALKIVLRSGRYELPPLTHKYFQDLARRAATRPTTTNTTRADADATRVIQAVATTQKLTTPPPWSSHFRSAQRRIALGAGEIWPEGALTLDNMRQGPLGDCYFVSVVGAVVHRDHDQLRQMVKLLDDGRYLITFPATQPVTVASLTDAQIAISSTSRGEGTWLALVEQGFGRLRASSAGKPDAAEVTDFIARGGSTGTSIAALTGHGRKSIGMPRDRDAGEASTLPRLRKELSSAMRDRRIVTASVAALPTTNPITNPTTAQSLAGSDTPTTAPTAIPSTRPSRKVSPRIVPPAINTKHAYAVLSYDEEADTVTFWNPHGNTFKPKGDPGLKNGYPTERGRFTVPLAEAYRFITTFTFETDQPATRPTIAPSTQPAR
jgi:hypothetical protein